VGDHVNLVGDAEGFDVVGFRVGEDEGLDDEGVEEGRPVEGLAVVGDEEVGTSVPLVGVGDMVVFVGAAEGEAVGVYV